MTSRRDVSARILQLEGENERLRQELRVVRVERDMVYDKYAAAQARNENLRAKLRNANQRLRRIARTALRQDEIDQPLQERAVGE